MPGLHKDGVDEIRAPEPFTVYLGEIKNHLASFGFVTVLIAAGAAISVGVEWAGERGWLPCLESRILHVAAVAVCLFGAGSAIVLGIATFLTTVAKSISMIAAEDGWRILVDWWRG